MIRAFGATITFLIIIAGCSALKPTLPHHQSKYITVEAINLSEDGSILSSQNDELALFIYTLNDHVISQSLEDRFELEASNTRFTSHHPSLELDKDYLVVLIEMDTNRGTAQINKIIRQHYKKLIAYQKSHDLIKIQDILDDDDLLGIQICKAESKNIKFSGSHRGDYYEYVIRF